MHKLLLICSLLTLPTLSYAQQYTQNPAGSGPTASSSSGIAEQASADSVSNYVFTGNKNLYSLNIKIGATTGYVMIFDAASLPVNGAVTPKWCRYVLSDGTAGGLTMLWAVPLVATTGLTVGFSTTGCDTLTASATAKIMGQAL